MEYRVEIEKMLKELRAEKEALSEIKQIVEESVPEVQKELAELASMEQEIAKRKEAAFVTLQTKAKSGLEDLAACEKAIERLQEKIKNYCHNLPREAIEKGLRVSAEGVNVSVSKTEFVSTYKTRDLLTDYPELEDAYLDGDPLCTVTIVPEVLDRLLDSGKVSIDNIDRYRIVTKKRSPSVSISFGDKK